MFFLFCRFWSLRQRYVKNEDLVSLAPQINKWNQGNHVANKSSLPIAIWSNLCKMLIFGEIMVPRSSWKNFFSHLLQTSLHCASNSFHEPDMQDNCKLLKRVTLPHTSADLLSDSILYEPKFSFISTGIRLRWRGNLRCKGPFEICLMWSPIHVCCRYNFLSFCHCLQP